MVLFSCGNKNEKPWIILDFGGFKLNTPADWTIIKLKGIDSYVGGLTNGRDTLIFDYGWYSPTIEAEDTAKYKMAIDTVNGLLAAIVIPRVDGKGIIAMSISNFNDKNNRFYIGGGNIKNTELILRIFKSLRFPESDTTKNPFLTMEKFVFLQPIGSGRALFKINCARCHYEEGPSILVGPPLEHIKSKRTVEWTFKFLSNRESLANDTAFINLTRGNDFHCPTFGLTKEEVRQILDYLD